MAERRPSITRTTPRGLRALAYAAFPLWEEAKCWSELMQYVLLDMLLLAAIAAAIGSLW